MRRSGNEPPDRRAPWMMTTPVTLKTADAEPLSARGYFWIGWAVGFSTRSFCGRGRGDPKSVPTECERFEPTCRWDAVATRSISRFHVCKRQAARLCAELERNGPRRIAICVPPYCPHTRALSPTSLGFASSDARSLSMRLRSWRIAVDSPCQRCLTTDIRAVSCPPEMRGSAHHFPAVTDALVGVRVALQIVGQVRQIFKAVTAAFARHACCGPATWLP